MGSGNENNCFFARFFSCFRLWLGVSDLDSFVDFGGTGGSPTAVP